MKKWKAPEPFKQYIDQLFEHFRCRLGLNEYEIAIKYFDEIPMDGEEAGACMQVVTDTVYLTIDVDIAKKVYKKYFVHNNYRGIALCVIHELVHPLTDPYHDMIAAGIGTPSYELLRQVNERQTERISRAIFSFVREHEYLPK